MPYATLRNLEYELRSPNAAFLIWFLQLYAIEGAAGSTAGWTESKLQSRAGAGEQKIALLLF